MTPSSTPAEPNSGGPCVTPLSDGRAEALRHYEAAATTHHLWMSVIPRAINFYYDAEEAKVATTELDAGYANIFTMCDDCFDRPVAAKAAHVVAPKAADETLPTRDSINALMIELGISETLYIRANKRNEASARQRFQDAAKAFTAAIDLLVERAAECTALRATLEEEKARLGALAAFLDKHGSASLTVWASEQMELDGFDGDEEGKMFDSLPELLDALAARLASTETE